jgi:hypothetical protein
MGQASAVVKHDVAANEAPTVVARSNRTAEIDNRLPTTSTFHMQLICGQ